MSCLVLLSNLNLSSVYNVPVTIVSDCYHTRVTVTLFTLCYTHSVSLVHLDCKLFAAEPTYHSVFVQGRDCILSWSLGIVVISNMWFAKQPEIPLQKALYCLHDDDQLTAAFCAECINGARFGLRHLKPSKS